MIRATSKLSAFTYLASNQFQCCVFSVKIVFIPNGS
jgi:hypothetical protein